MLPQAYRSPRFYVGQVEDCRLFRAPSVVGAISDCQACIGDRILTDPAPRTTPNVCDCYTIEGNAMRLVLERLGTIIDTQKGEQSLLRVSGNQRALRG